MQSNTTRRMESEGQKTITGIYASNKGNLMVSVETDTDMNYVSTDIALLLFPDLLKEFVANYIESIDIDYFLTSGRRIRFHTFHGSPFIQLIDVTTSGFYTYPLDYIAGCSNLLALPGILFSMNESKFILVSGKTGKFNFLSFKEINKVAPVAVLSFVKRVFKETKRRLKVENQGNRIVLKRMQYLAVPLFIDENGLNQYYLTLDGPQKLAAQNLRLQLDSPQVMQPRQLSPEFQYSHQMIMGMHPVRIYSPVTSPSMVYTPAPVAPATHIPQDTRWEASSMVDYPTDLSISSRSVPSYQQYTYQSKPM